MTGSSIIFKYFPELSETQKNQFFLLQELYAGWNEKINLISRKDIEFLYERHVLHSLAIAKVVSFIKDAEILDAGTGGGFPGIPLAIFFPETKFILVDSIGKKIKVVKEIVSSLNLSNLTTTHLRVEEMIGTFDFVISRATASIDNLVNWTKGKYKKENLHSIKNGLICLKGGDMNNELKNYKSKVNVIEIKNFFEEEFFSEKKVICLPVD